MVADQPPQGGEHPGPTVGAESAPVADDQLAQVAFELALPGPSLGVIEQFGQGVGGTDRVVAIHRQQEQSERRSGRLVQPPDRAEVEQGQMPVVVQEDVARMQIGVEHAGHQDLSQHRRQQLPGYLGPPVVRQRLQQVVGLAQRRSRYPVHDQQRGTGQLRIRPWHAHHRIRQRCRHGRKVVGLDPVVQLLQQRVGEAAGQPNSADRPRPVRRPLQPVGQPDHDVQVHPDLGRRGGPADLDHHRCAVDQPCAVHLPDRRGGERIRVDLAEDLLDRPRQIGCQHRLQCRPGHRRGIVLQPGQLPHVRLRHDVGA